VLKWINIRRHGNVETLAVGFEAILRSDGYVAYSNYAEIRLGVRFNLLLWSTLRKFRGALEREPVHAEGIMKLISRLYKIEGKWNQIDVSHSKRHS
jgi:hypothetical protein